MKPLCAVIVPGEPVPKGRPRVGRHGARTPARTVNAEARIGWTVKAAVTGAPGIPSDRPCRVRLRFRSRFAFGDGRAADVDNCIKLVLDALNGILWLDDKQVVSIRADMEHGWREPGTTIEVEEV